MIDSFFYRSGIIQPFAEAPKYEPVLNSSGEPRLVPIKDPWLPIEDRMGIFSVETPMLFIKGVCREEVHIYLRPSAESIESADALRTSWIVQKIRALYSVDDELKLTNEALQATLSGETPSEAYIAYRNAVSTIKAESVSYKNSLILAEQQRLADWEESHKDVDFSEEAVQQAIDAIPVPPPIPEPEPEPVPDLPPPSPFFIPSV